MTREWRRVWKSTAKVLKRSSLSRGLGIVFIILFAAGGSYLLTSSHAATNASSIEAEKGVVNGAGIISDSSASNSGAVLFGSNSGGSAPSCPGLTTFAFCDNFNAPAGTGNRSGQLNGNVWGVSRIVLGQNLGDGWADDWPLPIVQTDDCNPNGINVQPDSDINICNGQVAETQNDGGTVTSLAMYPKQPFDFSGRTGTVVFDVSDDSEGSHAAWPEFWMTNLPNPAPFIHEADNDYGGSTPQDGFGIRFAANCTAGVGCGLTGPNCFNATQNTVSVDSAVVVQNYLVSDTFNGANSVGVKVTNPDCVIEASGPGEENHVELKINVNEIDVYATDAFTGTWNPAKNPLREIATVTSTNSPLLSLTKGLIWLEDAHYNGNKFNNQRIDTFTWDNVGFDGPVLPRDFADDVDDHLVAGNQSQAGTSTLELGWPVPADGTTLSLTFHDSIPQSAINNATTLGNSTALLCYNIYTFDDETISYNLNNTTWHNILWPFPDSTTYVARSRCQPVSLSEVKTGTNTIQLKSSNGAQISNVDLVLVGGNGMPNPSTPID